MPKFPVKLPKSVRWGQPLLLDKKLNDLKFSFLPCSECDILLHCSLLIKNTMNSSLHHLQEILLGTRSGAREGKSETSNWFIRRLAKAQCHGPSCPTSNCVSVTPHNRQFQIKKPTSNEILSWHSIRIPGNLYLSLTPWQLRYVQDLNPSDKWNSPLRNGSLWPHLLSPCT